MSTVNTIKRRAGFTLPELLIGIGLASILAVMLAYAMFFTSRSYAGLLNYIQLDSNNRRALDIVVRDIRQVDYMSQYGGNEVHFQWTDPSDNVSKELQFIYDPATKQLIRKNGSVQDVKALVTDCSPITGHSVFEIYSRVPTAADPWQPWNAFGTGSIQSNVKAVKVQWISSRRILGIINSESVQTTMIVMRNQ